MNETPRRHPLDKQRFAEGNRQKFVIIGLILTVGILICNILWRIDPSPYLQSVMLLIGSGVLGWSLDSAVKAYKVDSNSTTTFSDSNSKIDSNQPIIISPKTRYYE